MIHNNGVNVFAAIIVLVAIPVCMLILFILCVLFSCLYFKYIKYKRYGTVSNSGSHSNEHERNLVLENNTIQMDDLSTRT